MLNHGTNVVKGRRHQSAQQTKTSKKPHAMLLLRINSIIEPTTPTISPFAMDIKRTSATISLNTNFLGKWQSLGQNIVFVIDCYPIHTHIKT